MSNVGVLPDCRYRYKGRWAVRGIDVAVKTLKGEAMEPAEFIKEVG
jgi:hypothetical protein